MPADEPSASECSSNDDGPSSPIVDLIEQIAFLPRQHDLGDYRPLACRDPARQIGQLRDLGILITSDSGYGSGLMMPALLRDLVLTRMWTSSPARCFSLIHRLSAHFLVSGEREKAGELFALIPADREVEVMEDAGGWMLALQFYPGILHRAAARSVRDIARYPRMAIAHAVDLARAGFSHEARSLLKTIASTTFPGSEGQVWLTELQINWLRLEIFADRKPTREMIDDLIWIIDHSLADEPVLYAIAVSMLCDAYYVIGRYESSREAGNRALALCQHSAMPYAAAHVFALTALSEYRMGELGSARSLARQMREHVALHFDCDDLLHDVGAIVTAFIEYDSGNIELANELLDRSYEKLISNHGLMEIGAAAFMTSANVAMQLGDIDRAIRTLKMAEEAGERHDFARLTQMAKCRAAYILLLAGRQEQATSVIACKNFPAVRDDPSGDRWSDYVNVGFVLSTSLRSIVAGEFDTALVLIRKFLEEGGCGSMQNVPAFVRANCLKLLAIVGSNGAPEETATTIRAIFYDVHDRGFRGAIAEFPMLRPALLMCSDWKALPADIRSMASHLSCFCGPVHAATSTVPLGRRHKEVLKLLTEGMTNKEIALQLGLAEGTIKTYRKKLYSKLAVSSRSQAIAATKHLL